MEKLKFEEYTNTIPNSRSSITNQNNTRLVITTVHSEKTGLKKLMMMMKMMMIIITMNKSQEMTVLTGRQGQTSAMKLRSEK